MQDEFEKRLYVFIRELAHVTKDRKVLRDQVLNVLLAGRDTTANLLGNLFFVLTRHKTVWNKLRAEINKLNRKLPSYEMLKGMKYLK